MQGVQPIRKQAPIIDGLVFMSDGTVEALRQGGVVAANVTVSGFLADCEEALDQIATWQARLDALDSPWAQILAAEDIARAQRAGKIGLIMGWQNLRPIGDNLQRLALFHRLGVRVMQLTYNEANFVGDGCLEARNGGLSAFGRSAVQEMNRVGIAIDLSHVGERSCLDAVEHSTRPVLITHANAKAIADAPRNKTDAVIRAVAATGGLVGLSVYGPMCWSGDASRRPQLDDFVRHLDHVVELVGVEHVALGTDFPAVRNLDTVSGIIGLTLDRYPAAISRYAQAFGNDVRTRYLEDCSSPAALPAIPELLLRRGWQDDDIRAFLADNYVKVLGRIWSP